MQKLLAISQQVMLLLPGGFSTDGKQNDGRHVDRSGLSTINNWIVPLWTIFNKYIIQLTTSHYTDYIF